MNRRELLKSGVAGLLPVILGKPVPALERVGQQLVLPAPASIVRPEDLLERLDSNVVRVTIADQRGAIIFDAIAAEASIEMRQPNQELWDENNRRVSFLLPYEVEATIRFVATGEVTWGDRGG